MSAIVGVSIIGLHNGHELALRYDLAHPDAPLSDEHRAVISVRGVTVQDASVYLESVLPVRCIDVAGDRTRPHRIAQADTGVICVKLESLITPGAIARVSLDASVATEWCADMIRSGLYHVESFYSA